MKNDRSFFCGNQKCKNGCIYCFSNFTFNNYHLELNALSVQSTNQIIYPICDSEILYQHEGYLDSLLDLIGQQKGYKVISISTKSYWSDKELSKLQTFNKVHAGDKVIKLSLSFSRKYELEKFEPAAIPYHDRIVLLKRLKFFSIPTAVIIKPILPFVTLEEYKSLIDDCLPICENFIIGPLYVDDKSGFYKKYIYEKYTTEKKYCEWLKSEVLCVNSANYKKIKAYITKCGCHCYDSDAEFLQTL